MGHSLRTRKIPSAAGPSVLVALALAIGAAPAAAQTISNVQIVKNGANTADQATTTGNVKAENRSTVAVLSSDGSSFDTRYAFVVGADRDGGLTLTSTTDTRTLNVSYTISFTVTSPGAYRLRVDQLFRGALDRIDDGGGTAGADLSAFAGTPTGGTIFSGSLALGPASAIANGNGNTDVPVLRTGTAIIEGVSNGSPVNHTLTFTATASCRTISGALLSSAGDECGIRGGLSSAITGYTAGIYPGPGARVAADDGHFVSVEFVPYCGNRVIDTGIGEECDLAEDNENETCCLEDCTIAEADSVCRASAGICDPQEVCDGESDQCPADAREPETTLCRGLSAGCATCNGGFADCDLEEYCDGESVDCPADLTKADADGDTTCDEFDNCPNTADPTLVDDDGDGVGNVCDACTYTGNDIEKPLVSIRKIDTPAADDVFKFTGRVKLPTSPPINPVETGVRFRFEDPDGNTVLDETIPAGAYNAALRAGWVAKPYNWTYKNNGKIVALVNGLNAVKITESKTVPGELRFSIKGKKGSYAVFPDEVPLKISLVLDTPFATTGQCGEVTLDSTNCRFDAAVSKLNCK